MILLRIVHVIPLNPIRLRLIHHQQKFTIMSVGDAYPPILPLDSPLALMTIFNTI